MKAGAIDACIAQATFPKEPIVPTSSTMPLYDPKGTRWASYTTVSPFNSQPFANGEGARKLEAAKTRSWASIGVLIYRYCNTVQVLDCE